MIKDYLLALLAPLAKLITKAAAIVSAYFFGIKHERAKNIKAIRDANARANDVSGRIAVDDDFRERVRRKFDNP